jgi:hypothetical protein
MKNWKKIAALFALMLLVFCVGIFSSRNTSALPVPCGSTGSSCNNTQDSTTGTGSAPSPIDPNKITYNGVDYVPIGGGRPTTLYGNTANAKTCYGGSVVVFDYNTGDGTVYKVTTTPDLTASLKSAAPSVASFFGPNEDCYIVGAGGTAINVPPPDKNGLSSAVTSVDNQNPDQGQACFQNSSGSPLTWLICPILDAASGMTNSLVRLFEDQLSFTVPVPQAGQTNANSLSANSLGNINDTSSGAYKTYKAWSYIRVIATILIVIVMLIMVVSQAIGSGPFDAYTVRKLLPKLIIAAILMQISWYVFAWVVNVVDDIGRGLADLLFAPFGGASKLDLWHLLANAKLSGGLLFAVNWGGLIGLAFLGVAFPFTMMGLALMAVLAIATGLFTLIFRKILIIMALVISPLALVMWILPGTDRYWKLWKDNFIKALLMFPLAVLIIVSGRIFAYITGTQDNSQFLNLIFILTGFFLPLFILPKTYQWGGTAMKMAGDAAFKASRKMGETPKKFLDTRQEGWAAERRRQSQERVANKVPFNRLRPWHYPIDQLRSGRWDPTLTGRRSQQAQDAYVHAGEETYQKDIEAARSRVLREGQDIRARGGNWDRYFQMVGDGVESYKDPSLIKKDETGKIIDDGTVNIGKRSEVEQDAARKQTAILGSATNWRYLEDYYQRANEKDDQGRFVMSEPERVRARKFFDDNVDKIMPKMPHVYQGYGAAADATGATLAGHHGVEVESILSKFSADIQDPTKSPEERASAQRSLLTYLKSFQAASQNPNISLDNGALRAVKGFLDSDEGEAFRESINRDPDPKTGDPRPDGREVRDLPALPAYDGLALAPEVKIELDRIKADLAPRIDNETGNLISHTSEPREPEPETGEPRTRRIERNATGAIEWTPESGSNTGGFDIRHDERS